MFEIHEQEEMIKAFDEKLWITTIEKVTVGKDGSLTFQFKNGMEIRK